MKKIIGIVMSVMLIVALSVPVFANMKGGPPIPPVDLLSAPISIDAE